MWKDKIKIRINDLVLNVQPALDKLGRGFHSFYNIPEKYTPYLEKTFKQRFWYWFNMFIWVFLVTAISTATISLATALILFLWSAVPGFVLFISISAGIIIGLASILRIR